MSQSYEKPVEETRFKAWLDAAGHTVFWASQQLKTSPRTVHLWANGQSIPTLPMAFAIDVLSEGQVPPASWLSLRVAQSRRGWQKVMIEGQR